MKAHRVLQPLLSVSLGLGIGLLITFLSGENPLNVLKILIHSAVGTGYDFGMTLFYTTPLIFTGLSVAMAFHAGLFNIGGEGQLALGALGMTVFGILCPNIPPILAPTLAVAVAFLVGAAWAAIAGGLLAKRGSHEVITTIMLNFIAAGLASYVTLYLFRNPESQNTETVAVSDNFLISHLSVFGDAPTSVALFIALFSALAIWIFLWHTRVGFEIRAVGTNPKAANAAGINVPKMQWLALSLAGGLAALAGVGEILGNATRYKLGFSPGYGFIGIAVALLGRARPLGVVASAFLFGALHKGTADLDIETQTVSRDLSLILQALIILSVSADGLWEWLKKIHIKKRSSQNA